MKEYLRKLGSRKFQSFVGAFATQLFILFRVDAGPWVDAIAAAGLVITTIVYIWVEGSIDKGTTPTVTGGVQDAEFKTPVESTE